MPATEYRGPVCGIVSGLTPLADVIIRNLLDQLTPIRMCSHERKAALLLCWLNADRRPIETR